MRCIKIGLQTDVQNSIRIPLHDFSNELCVDFKLFVRKNFFYEQLQTKFDFDHVQFQF